MFNFYGPIYGDIVGVGDGELEIHSSDDEIGTDDDKSVLSEIESSEDDDVLIEPEIIEPPMIELPVIDPPIIEPPVIIEPHPVIVDPLVPQGRYAKQGQYCGYEYAKCQRGLRCVPRSGFGIGDGKKICVEAFVHEKRPKPVEESIISSP